MLSIFVPYLATMMVVSSMLSAHCSAAASCSEHLEMALAEPSGVVGTCGISNLITLRFLVIGGVGLQTHVDACRGGGRQAAMVSRHRDLQTSCGCLPRWREASCDGLQTPRSLHACPGGGRQAAMVSRHFAPRRCNWICKPLVDACPC